MCTGFGVAGVSGCMAMVGLSTPLDLGRRPLLRGLESSRKARVSKYVDKELALESPSLDRVDEANRDGRTFIAFFASQKIVVDVGRSASFSAPRTGLGQVVLRNVGG